MPGTPTHVLGGDEKSQRRHVRNDRPIYWKRPYQSIWPIGNQPTLRQMPLATLCKKKNNQGWVFKFEGGLEQAKEFSPAVAVGRLGVAFSDSRPPRLVVDSSECGVNAWCGIPERKSRTLLL